MQLPCGRPFTDFPLTINSNKMLIDEFAQFLLTQYELNDTAQHHLREFHEIMKNSRLGLYQECLSTTKITKFKELIINKSISTIRSVPYYESGEIFLTRLVSYLGDTFQIHDPRYYPPDYKDSIIDMVNNKLFFRSDTGNIAHDYQKFMKFAGLYWMSCTHPDQSMEIFSPDHFERYYSNSVISE